MCFEKRYHLVRLFNLHQRTFPDIIFLQKCYYLFQINELKQNYLEKDVHQKQRPRAVTLTLSIGFLWNFVHNLFFSQLLIFWGTGLQNCPYSCLNLKKRCRKIREKRPFLIYANLTVLLGGKNCLSSLNLILTEIWTIKLYQKHHMRPVILLLTD